MNSKFNQKYRCNKCSIDCETSVCPTCGERAEQLQRVFWCSTCNVPLLFNNCPICHSECGKIGSDIRPVFPEERLLLEILKGSPMEYAGKSVWNTGGNRYIVDGAVMLLSKRDYKDFDPQRAMVELAEYGIQNQESYKSFNEYVDMFIVANKERFSFIDSEAITSIQKVSVDFEQSEMFVSFSGGKDSSVVSDLVIRALANPRVIHIYGDTTLEFPLTSEYIKLFRQENTRTPLLTAKNNDKDFYELIDTIGPPSRVMRWCCIVFKTGAITKRIQRAFKDTKRILTFYGIRRSESASRSKYEKSSDSPKITKQRVMSPIIDWLDFDVWLYLLTRRIEFNRAYRLGYSRVGCWCCPNNTDWSTFLSKVYMPEESAKFTNCLIEFAKKIGKPDPEEYVESGNWKARQGGNGLDISKKVFVKFEECAKETNTFNYELSRTISQDIYEIFKPFGSLNFDIGNKKLNEVYVQDRNGVSLLRIQGRIGQKTLKISVLKLPLARSKSIREAEQKIKCQLTKYQMCIGCVACGSVCKYNAISLLGQEDGSYRYEINEKLCTRCGECINHFDGGCYMRKVIMTKQGVK